MYGYGYGYVTVYQKKDRVRLDGVVGGVGWDEGLLIYWVG